MNYNYNMDRIKGTVIPLPVPFNKDASVDYEGMRKYVDFLATNGIETVMTTVGTSRFNLLTTEEIKKINEAVVEAAAGRLTTIVANPPVGSTQHAIEFAQHAESIGADFFLVYFPERHYGDENSFAFFQALAEAVNIDILIHEMPRRNGFGGGMVQYSMDLLERLLAIKNIVGLKEEALDAAYSNEIVKRFKDEAIIIGAGGGMSRYLDRDFGLGAKAYLGGIGNFYPQLELDFYKAITSGGQEKAAFIVNEIERPYFNAVVPYGWHPTLKVALAALDLLSPYERSPMLDLDAAARAAVKEAVQKVLNYSYEPTFK